MYLFSRTTKWSRLAANLGLDPFRLTTDFSFSSPEQLVQVHASKKTARSLLASRCACGRNLVVECHPRMIGPR